MPVPFARQTLANGLDVIVHETRRVPLVAVNVWYHVGSRHERPGRTGLAHLFEHLMFEGSAHQPKSYFEPLQQVGGSLNGSTSTDRTNYWEVVPTEAARLALWMEADRMGWLLPALTAERFATQRDVVLNERRQNYENRPYGLAQFALMAAVFRAHPYGWPTIGHPADLLDTSVDDAHAFFATHYHPGNASLAIAGDISERDAFAMAEEYFGEIPAGPGGFDHRARPAVPVARHQRLCLVDRVELPRLYLAWPSPALFAADDAELDLLADVLGNGRTSRLYARLIHERRIATELAAAQSSREVAGTFQLLATPAPGRTLAELRSAIFEEIARARETGLSAAELDRGRAQAEAAFVFRTQTLGGFGGKADQLNAYNTYLGTPDAFDRDLARYLDTTRDSIREAAARWLDETRAVELSVVPLGGEALALPDSQPVPEAAA